MNRTINNRQRIEKIILGCIFGAVLVIAVAIPCISYAQYTAYYNSVTENGVGSGGSTIGDPVLEGISVRLAEGKEFFDNGKAAPVKSDFVVEGTYRISEEETYLDVIPNDNFMLEIPENFATNGGRITVQSGEFTAFMDIDLTPVRLSSLYLLSEPYIVTYKAGDTFSSEGMRAEASYNDGTVVHVGTEYAVETTGPLTVGTEKVTISYSKDGEKVTCDVPITVMSAAAFTNGNIVALEAEEDAVVGEGEPFASAAVTLRATYESGNRLLISADDYTIVNAEETALLGDASILDIRARDGEVSLRCPLRVVAHREAEDGSSTGGGDTNVTLTKGGVLRITADATSICSADIRISLNSPGLTYGKLNRTLAITVNGAIRAIDADVELQHVGQWTEITLLGVKLYSGQNTIAFTLIDDSTLTVDWIEIVSDGSSASAITLGEYVAITENLEFLPESLSGASPLVVSGLTGFSGACTDGTDIYYAFADDLNNECRIVRYNVEQNGIVDMSEKFYLADDSQWWWQSANLACIEGKIIVVKADGSLLAFDAKTLDQTVCDIVLPDYSEDFPAESTDIAATYKITSVQYNEKMQRYAVTVKGAWWENAAYLYIYDSDFNPIVLRQRIESHPEDQWGGYNCRGLSGNADYLYALYSEDGKYKAYIQIFDWNGNLLEETEIDGLNPFGTPLCNVENMVELDGWLYIGVYNHSGLNGGAIYRVKLNDPLPRYSVKSASVGVDAEGKPQLTITGNLFGYTAEDFTLRYARLDPWPWVYSDIETFEMTTEGGQFTLTADLSFLTSADDKTKSEDGIFYQKYIFYFMLNGEEEKALPFGNSQTFIYDDWRFEVYSEYGNLALKLTEAVSSYSVSAAQIEQDAEGKPQLTITGSLFGYTAEDFTLRYARLDPWPWVYSDIETFEMTTEGGQFTLTADLSFLTTADDKNTEAGEVYQKYIFYFMLNGEEQKELPFGSGQTFIYNGWEFEVYSEYGNLALQVTEVPQE